MPKYVKLYSEYLGFVNSVKAIVTDPYEAKIVNLIADNFDEIAEKGIAQGSRADFLNRLIQKNGSAAKPTIEIDSGTIGKKSFPLRKIKSLRVSHFRGFSFDDAIDMELEKQHVFIYGPNGSGKSSFCEAIEYSLLGYISEAVNRRIEISTYIKNKFSNKGISPTLFYHHTDGREDQIKPDGDLYQFCFVEKNRIENFARISSSTPKDKQSRIAALFGLTEFNDFVKGFTPNFENKLDVVGVLNAELATKSQYFTIHKSNIEAAKSAVEEKNKKIAEILTAHGFSESYEKWHNQNFGPTGTVEKLEEGLKKEIGSKLEVADPLKSVATFSRLFENVTAIRGSCQHYFGSRSQINFRDLYQAIHNLHESIQRECPACQTPLDKVVIHPSIYANSRLKELAEISEIEKKIRADFRTIMADCVEANSFLNSLASTAKAVEMEFEFQPLNLPAASTIEEIEDVLVKISALLEFQKNNKGKIETIVEAANTKNKLLDSELAQKIELMKKKEQLQNIDTQIKFLIREIGQHNENISKWSQDVAQFEKVNEDLIKKAALEKVIVAENKKYLEAYNGFLSKIKKYMEDLPVKYLENLNSLTTELYNEINSHDMEYEKAHRIVLPKNIDESIYIYFQNDKSKKLDALDVLSEGHIKCLGLAILLAKNIHDDCPIIVFDDIVNAIDDDHRGGIRELLLTNKKFETKQMLLTTHSTQFMKELAQHHEVNKHASLVMEYNFSTAGGKRGIRYTNSETENYLSKAERYFAKSKWPDALANCRCALENLAHKLWKKLGNKKYKADLSVILRAPGGKPDLKSIIDAQIKLMKTLKVPELLKISDSFEYFSGQNADSIVRWSYLNTGTHEEEERSEFDQLIVKGILDKLKEVDVGIKAL